MHYSKEKAPLQQSHWFKSWFDSVYYHLLYSHRDEKEAADFIDELVAGLRPAAGSIMLDVGCGAGRHSKSLAAKGYKVTGFDLAFSSIRLAKKYESETLKFYLHDMRRPFGNNYYDFVFSFFTSFGYFQTEKENEKVIINMSRSLKPGGKLVMDYINIDFAEPRLVPYEIKEIDGIVYHIRRWTDERIIYKQIKIENGPGSKLFSYTEQVGKWQLNHFKSLFQRNNLQVRNVFGDYSLNEYDRLKSPRLIIVAEKIKVMPGVQPVKG